jgi:hypothetical protein
MLNENNLMLNEINFMLNKINFMLNEINFLSAKFTRTKTKAEEPNDDNTIP